MTSPEATTQGFHSALLRHISSFTLLIGVIGFLLLLLLLLLPRSRWKEFSSFRLQEDSLPPPVSSLLRDLLLDLCPHLPYLPLVVSLPPVPNPGPGTRIPFQDLSGGFISPKRFWLALPAPYLIPCPLRWWLWPLPFPMASLYLLMGLFPLFFLYLVILAGRREGTVYGKNGQRPALLSILGLLTLIFYFSLTACLALQAPTYLSPGYFQQIAVRVKTFSPVEVLFDEALDYERKEKISRFRFYLEVPVRRVEIETYLRGEERKGKERSGGW